MEEGTFAYRGSAAFTASGNSEARYAGQSRIQVDADGDGAADLTLTLTGLTSASQLTGDDFLWS